MKIKTDNNLFYFLILLALSLLVHFFHYGKPEQVVFDEVHFGKYVSAYCCNSQRIFDIHPPHAKILIAETASLLGYSGGQDFSNISIPFAKSENRPLRLLPTLMGTLFIPVIFILMLQLNATPAAAFFAATLLLFDTALLTQSRFIFLDSTLLLAIFASLSLLIHASRQARLDSAMLFFALSGAFTALAVGTKFTGLVVFSLVFFYAIYDLARQKSIACGKRWGIALLVFFGFFVIIYLGGWQIHFTRLNQPGPGDIWGILTGSFWDKLYHIHVNMLKANANLTTPHHDASMWWGWPIMHKPVYYWNGMDKKIYLIGNPMVWWSSVLLLLTAAVTTALMKVSNLSITPPRISEPNRVEPTESSKENKSRPLQEKTAACNKPMLWFPLLGYLAAFLPLVAVSRPLFLYHYFTPLVFSIMFVTLWLDKIVWLRPVAIWKQRLSVYLYLSLTLVAFLLLSSLSYGLPYGIAISDFIFTLFPDWR